jgi:hypothetical protein
VRNVSATRASIARAGWQQVKNRRSRSSGIAPASAPEALELAQLLRVAAIAAQPVDRAVPGGESDPAGRVGGHALDRPTRHRLDERLLHGVLGEVEVAEHPDQGRDRPPRLAPEQAVDDRAGRR